MSFLPFLGLAAGFALQPMWRKHVVAGIEIWISKEMPAWISGPLLFKIGKRHGG
jgi:hypothetical protein